MRLMTAAGYFAEAARVWSLVAFLPLCGMFVATWLQGRAEPYSASWRRRRRARAACRGLASPAYALVALLGAAGGDVAIAVIWFLLMLVTLAAARLNRNSEALSRCLRVKVMLLCTHQLTDWHNTWERWDALGRPIEGAEYTRVMKAPAFTRERT